MRRKMNKRATRKAFTLVELVIVIAVIGILASVLIPTFASVINSAKDNASMQQATNARDEFIATNLVSPEEAIGLLIETPRDLFIVNERCEVERVNRDDYDLNQYDQLPDIPTIKDVHIYTKKNTDIYTITFLVKDGDIVGNKKVYTKYESDKIYSDYELTQESSIPEALGTKKGYNSVFEGWQYGNAEVGVLVINEDGTFTNETTKSIFKNGKYNVESDINLYAKFERTAIEYTISYELDGGTNNENNPAKYTIEDEIILKDATKENYTFKGWYTDSEFNGEPITKIAKGTTNDVTLYAKFVEGTESTYSVEYYLQNIEDDDYTLKGEDTKSDIKGATGETVTADINTYEGFEQNTSSEKIAEASGEVKFDGSLVLKVYYNRIKYTITWQGVDGVLKTKKYKYEAMPLYEGETPTKPQDEGYTYTFSDWTPEISKVVSDTTYIAQFNGTAKTYSITYNLNGGELESGKTNLTEYTIETETFTLNNPTRIGYTFTGWTGSNGTVAQTTVTINKGTTGNLTYTANYNAILYPITYNLNEGTLEKGKTNLTEYTIETETFTLNNPTRTGYAFTGWTGSNITGTQKKVTISKGTTGDLTYTANYNVETYKIIYILDGTNDSSNPETYTIETETITLQPATKSGYKFEGWYSEKQLWNEVKEIKKGEKTGDITLYAKFSQNFETSETSDGKLIITKYKQWDTDVEIPSSIDGKQVVAIGDNAFTSTGLISIIIADSVTTIGDSAFQNCYKLTSITLPSGLTSIGNSTFQNCYELTSITLPSGLTTIGDSAFYGTGLTSVTLYEGVTSIGNLAFYNCMKLTNITLPSGLTSIGNSTFQNCYKLTSITLPDKVTIIGNGAFQNCSDLTSVILSDSLITIEESAFNGCSRLKSITIPKSVENIGSNAFYGTYLENATFESPENWTVTNDEYTYEIPGSSIDFASLLRYEDTDGGYANYEWKKTYQFTTTETNGQLTITGYTGTNTNVEIPSSIGGKPVVALNQYSFNGKNIENVIIPDSVTSIGRSAFESCTSLSKVIISGSVATIGLRAFSGCTNLTDVTMEEGIKTIESNVFADCRNLKEIVIPNSVTSIGGFTFSGCAGLEKITLPFIGDKRHNLDDNYQYPLGYIFGQAGYTGCTPVTQDYYASSTTSTTYYIPATLKNVVITDCSYILCGAFYNCKNLTSVTIPSSVTTIKGSAFYECTNLTNVIFENPNNWTVTSNTGVVNLNSSDLSNQTTAAEKLKGNCEYDWERIVYETTESNGELTITKYIGTDTDIVIPSLIGGKPVVAIGSEAFYTRSDSNITSIIIPDTVTSIGQSAFKSCSNLTSITLPNNLTTIETETFWGCSNLTSITIPSSVTNIEGAAFYDCWNLSSATFENPNGWTATQGSDRTETFKASDLSNQTTAAEKLKDYCKYNWVRKEVYETTESNGQLTITEYTGTDTDVVIPSSINGKPVVAISYGVFMNNSKY